MTNSLLIRNKKNAIPIRILTPKDIRTPAKPLQGRISRWIKALGFKASAGETALVTGKDGDLEAVLFGTGAHAASDDALAREARGTMAVGRLARQLPAGTYQLAGMTGDMNMAALAWELGGYAFRPYLSEKSGAPAARLQVDDSVDIRQTRRIAAAVRLTRDLVNTPANDLGPKQLENACRSLGRRHKARVTAITGEALLKRNLPMIHAVGRASSEAPRLLDMRWGKAADPKVTLVGKGVSFDTGGLNIKPGSSMALMKKDMGGAANVLGLAAMIMDAKLPVRLRVLIPAVENAISGNAFRPGDILPSRKGISVEIGNTDAEGRLILADALALADEEKPELLIDMATLTGAARVALGPDLPPFYTADEAFAAAVGTKAMQVNDPVWRMPLWPPYQEMLASKVADVNHITGGGFAGSLTAALFLSSFVDKAKIWAHFDIFAWVPKDKPWAPAGGEAQAIRALYAVLQERYPG